MPKRASRRATAKARHGGRPRAADVDKLNQDILTAAGELFMENGFDGTSMDAVAEKAKCRNVRFTCVMPTNRHCSTPQCTTCSVAFWFRLNLLDNESGDLEFGIGWQSPATWLRAWCGRSSWRCIVWSRSRHNRRPEFGRWIYEVRRRPAVQVIATVLQRHRDELRLTDFERAAEQFMSLTVDVAVRLGAFGMKIAAREMEDQLKAAVDLFLNGARRHGTRDQSITRRSKAAS